MRTQTAPRAIATPNAQPDRPCDRAPVQIGNRVWIDSNLNGIQDPGGVVNAAISGDNTIYRRDINVGIAVALDWGLIVPVIFNAETKGMSVISAEAKALAKLGAEVVAANLDDADSLARAFSGADLSAISRGDWQSASLRCAKQLNRQLLRPLLGPAPLHSRSLFRQD